MKKIKEFWTTDKSKSKPIDYLGLIVGFILVNLLLGNLSSKYEYNFRSRWLISTLAGIFLMVIIKFVRFSIEYNKIEG